jgi:hypothetical protein
MEKYKETLVLYGLGLGSGVLSSLLIILIIIFREDGLFLQGYMEYILRVFPHSLVFPGAVFSIILYLYLKHSHALPRSKNFILELFRALYFVAFASFIYSIAFFLTFWGVSSDIPLILGSLFGALGLVGLLYSFNIRTYNKEVFLWALIAGVAGYYVYWSKFPKPELTGSLEEVENWPMVLILIIWQTLMFPWFARYKKDSPMLNNKDKEVSLNNWWKDIANEGK